MTITIETTDLSKLEIISKLKSITSLELIFKVPIKVTNNNFKFLKEMENLKSLSMNPSYIERDFFNDMKLDNIYLDGFYDIDYKSLNVNKIKFSDGPYTIIKYIDDIDLINNIKLSSDSYSENDFTSKIIYINNKINDIIDNMNLYEVSDNERVKNIVSYFLDNYKEDHVDEDTYNDLLKSEGELYFSLEDKYKKQDSYISLMELLFRRLNINNIDFSDLFRIDQIKDSNPKRYKIRIDNRIWIVNEEIANKMLPVFNNNMKEKKKLRRIYELNKR